MLILAKFSCIHFELLDDRYGNRSTLVASQMPVDKWHALVGDPTLGDAILDRLVHNAYRIEGRIDAQTRGEIDHGGDFRLTMQTCVAARQLPVQWTGNRCPSRVESAIKRSK